MLLHMRRHKMLFPRPTDGKRGPISWRSPAYRNVISVLQNPVYTEPDRVKRWRRDPVVCADAAVRHTLGRKPATWVGEAGGVRPAFLPKLEGGHAPMHPSIYWSR